MTDIVQRKVPLEHRASLLTNHSPVMSGIFAAREIANNDQLDNSIQHLLHFSGLKNSEKIANLLADAITQKKKILVVADYDADGATACTVAVRGLRMFGADVCYIVPNRFEYGYGLTPEIVRLAAKQSPNIILTVDNGIASVNGVVEANKLGIQVFVTDHHLPGDVIPDAAVIVNPNQPGCTFPNKHLAGVGVMFYVLLALRSELRDRGTFEKNPCPNLATLLDFVALGTVADVVRLDQQNRILVENGLKRIREGKAHAGINALFKIAKKEIGNAVSGDLGFSIGPRLNAAGRLDDMSMGIECLLTDDPDVAKLAAEKLDSLNKERREIETEMKEEALAGLEEIDCVGRYSIVLFDEKWHQGVIGIVASRLKELYHRPTIVFAQSTSSEDEIKGSGRSIPALHLRDALDLVYKKYPNLIRKFGGHSMAAGLTISKVDLKKFVDAFEYACRQMLNASDLEQHIETDGELKADEITLKLANDINSQVWGQGFPAPTFDAMFQVISQRLMGGKHLKLLLSADGKQFEAVLFNQIIELPGSAHLVYSVGVNRFRGEESLQLMVQHCETE